MSILKKLSLYPIVLKYFSPIGKRRRFIIATFALVFLMLFSSFFSFEKIRIIILPLAILTYLMTFFAILEGISKDEWIILFIHPVYFTVAFDLFFFLLPVRWLTRIPFIAIYAVSIYAIMLSSNIFNVGVSRALQLFRVAFSINFLFLALSAFLVFNVMLSLKLGFIADFFLITIAIFPLALQFLWSIDPKEHIKKELIFYAAIIALLVAEFGLVFSFIPIKPVIFSLFLSSYLYSLLGLFHAYIDRRLFKERIREFVVILIVVTVITLFSASW